LRRGHHHDDVFHPRHLGRNGIHQHAAGIRRLAAGYVNAHAVQRRDLLAQQGTVFVTVAPAFAIGLLLCLVVAAHTACGGFQCFALVCRQAVESGLEFFLGQLQRGHGVGAQAVKAGGVLQHGGIAALLHIGQDVGHTLFDGGVRVRRPMQTRSEIMLKLGICG